MSMEFTEDQIQFREMIGRFMSANSSPTDVRRLMETDDGYDPDMWRKLCDDLGLAGTPFPEAQGGFGFGPVELGIAMEQMGKHLYCGPYFSSAVMAGYALLFLAEDKSLLADICSGSTLATLVLDDLNSAERLGHQLSVDNEGALSGAAGIVIDAQVADHLLVVARGESGLGLYQADPDSAVISRRESIDATRKLSTVTFEKTAAIHLGAIDESVLQKFWDHVCVALAHEMMGGAQRLFDTTVEYTQIRYQFGRPIGSFQALKHRCADLLLELEFAKAATYDAAVCLATGSGPTHAPSLAKAMASDAYIEAARTAIQLRGGIGFTWEEDTQLWFKRAKSSEVLMGSPHLHRERMMTLIEAQEDVA